MIAGLERAGAKDVRCELTHCGCNSSNRCEFRFEWR
jgi:predicted hydrocarbon binding protein